METVTKINTVPTGEEIAESKQGLIDREDRRLRKGACAHSRKKHATNYTKPKKRK